MKSFKVVLLLAIAATLAHTAQAAGEHSGGHGSMQGHDMRGQGAPAQHASRAGAPGDAARAGRTVEVEMSEFRFSPETLEVKAGETIRFRVRNAGRIEHEMVFGDAAELKEHAEQMRKQPMLAHHGSGGLTLKPGTSGEMTWTFTSAGQFQVGCLIPGHYEAGMVGTVVVK